MKLIAGKLPQIAENLSFLIAQTTRRTAPSQDVHHIRAMPGNRHEIVEIGRAAAGLVPRLGCDLHPTFFGEIRLAQTQARPFLAETGGCFIIFDLTRTQI